MISRFHIRGRRTHAARSIHQLFFTIRNSIMESGYCIVDFDMTESGKVLKLFTCLASDD